MYALFCQNDMTGRGLCVAPGELYQNHTSHSQYNILGSSKMPPRPPPPALVLFTPSLGAPSQD